MDGFLHRGGSLVRCAHACLFAGLSLSSASATVELEFYSGWQTARIGDLYIKRNLMVEFTPNPAFDIQYNVPVGSGNWYSILNTAGRANGWVMMGSVEVTRGNYGPLTAGNWSNATFPGAWTQIRLRMVGAGVMTDSFTFPMAPFGGINARGKYSNVAPLNGIERFIEPMLTVKVTAYGYTVFDPTDPINKDTDGDGIPDVTDTDDDGDGMPDTSDPLPLIPAPPNDLDQDGILNDQDPDDDNDGILDAKDPDHPSYDFDGDGIPDVTDPDDDNDGIVDSNDPIPRSIYDPENPRPDKPIDPDHDDDGDGTPDHLDPTPSLPPPPPGTPPPTAPPPPPPGTPGGGGGEAPIEGEPANNNAAMNALEGSDGGLGGKSTGAPAKDLVGGVNNAKGQVGKTFGGFKVFGTGSIPKASAYTTSLNFGPKFGPPQTVSIDFTAMPFTVIRPIIIAMIAIGFGFAFVKFAKV